MEYFDFSSFLINHTQAMTFEGNSNCRMAAYFAQQGRCYVTGRPTSPGARELHHRQPRFCGGPDTAENTVLLDKTVHRLIHAYSPKDIQALLQEVAPTEEQLRLINQLRMEAGREKVETLRLEGSMAG